MKSLIGRTVLINWHSFNANTKEFGGDMAKLVQYYRDSGSMNALYRAAADHFNQEAEIIGHSEEHGFKLMFSDGSIGPGAEMFFIVLPKKPAPVQAWEYKTGQAAAFNGEDLNKFGADGWELVSVLLCMDVFNLVFKRPVIPANKK